nr:immunoglobulin light chain junction region [Macaca mulatta]MOX28224.1 immunoglobulin light chain junction region [Macaca mulatta]MOX29208.1 immunoglobulin light chain junction region [Macaca mulatta]MOX29328.1 immunoglobulin light chain junction region [Macaca mulatta]MOX30826.1 immunoglobulin light chain junction region [Macaca mulatta]
DYYCYSTDSTGTHIF